MLRYYALTLLLLLTMNTSEAIFSYYKYAEQPDHVGVSDIDAFYTDTLDFTTLLENYCTASTKEDEAAVYEVLGNNLKRSNKLLYDCIINNAHNSLAIALLWLKLYKCSQAVSITTIENNLIIGALYIAETKALGCQDRAKHIIEQLINDERSAHDTLTTQALLRAQEKLNTIL